MPYADAAKRKAYHREYYLRHREAQRIAGREWHDANRETANASSRARYWRHAEEERRRARERYHANRTTRLVQQREWYKKHRHEETAKRSKRRLENIDRERAREKAWRLANPDKDRARRARGKARRRGVPLNLNASLYVEAISNDPCVYCNTQGKLSLEHITPVSRGGDSHWTNLAFACLECNGKKNANLLTEFLLRGGMRKAA